MVKGGSNIDIVFRNGLKNVEVLPPPEVWNGIQSAIVTRKSPFLFLKAAAAIAILLVSGFIAYSYLKSSSPEFGDEMVTFNVPAPPSIHIVPSFLSQLIPENKIIPVADENIDAFPSFNIDDLYDITAENNSLALVRPDIYSKDFGFSGTKSVNATIPSLLNTNREKETKIYLPLITEIAEDVSKPKSPMKWSVAALASPTYFSHLSTGNSDISKQLNASEQARVSYSGGFAFTYKIGRKLSVQSGLYYSSLSQQIDGINSFGGFQKFDYTKGDHNFEVPTTIGPIYSTNSDIFLVSSGHSNRVITTYTNDVFDPKKANLQYLNSNLEQNFSYLELPVMLRYKLIDKTLGLNMLGGISYNMLVGNSVFTTVNGNRYEVGTTVGVNSFTLSSSLGMGMEYSFSSKLSMNLEPTLRYYLNPFSKSEGTNIHPYSFGIFSGLSYKF